MKKLKICCLFIIIVLTACSKPSVVDMDAFTFGDSIYYPATEDEIFNSKSVHYDNLKDLEDDTEYIVIAKKIEETNGFFNTFTTSFTSSKFVVTKSFKGNLKIGDEFFVKEKEFFHEKIKKNIHIMGYELSELEKEYLLFLRYEKEINYYFTKQNSLGKIPIDKNEEGKLTKNLKKSDHINSKDILKLIKEENKELKDEAYKKYVKK